MTKSSQKKGQNYIPFLQSTYPEMQRKTSSGGQGAPPARQSGAGTPGPGSLVRNLHTLKCKENLYLE